MDRTEKELEDYLFAHPEALRVDRWIGRQFRVPSGIIDLIGVKSDPFGEYVIVVELKNKYIDSAALTQVYRYAHDIAEAVCLYRDIDEGDIRKTVIGIGVSNDKVLFEAEAMGISVHNCLIINSNIFISERYCWTQEKRHEIYSDLMRLANHSELHLIYENRIDWREKS